MKTKFILFVLLTSLSAIAEECNFMEQRVQPAWVTSLAQSNIRFYGSGVADKQDSFADQQSMSRQSALQNLAENIETNIKSSVTVVGSINTANGTSASDIYAKNVSESIASAQLANITTEDTWLDRKNCVLWTLLSVSKVAVSEARQREQSKTLSKLVETELTQIEQQDLSNDPISARATLGRIEKALTSINPDFAISTFNVSSIERRINAFERRLNKAELSNEQIDRAYTQFQSAFQAYSPSRSRFSDLLAIDELISQGISVASLKSARGDDVYDDLMQVLELEELKDNDCYAEQRTDLLSRQFRSYRRDMRIKQRDYDCTEEATRSMLFERLFLGNNILIYCNATLSSDADISKACSDIATELNQMGASTILVDKIESNISSPIISITADGKLNNREKAPGRNEYQVDAQVTTLTRLPNGREINQSYQGITGWVPANPQLASDILSINIVKRWQKELQNAIN